jgi:hypothetical protein
VRREPLIGHIVRSLNTGGPTESRKLPFSATGPRSDPANTELPLSFAVNALSRYKAASGSRTPNANTPISTATRSG